MLGLLIQLARCRDRLTISMKDEKDLLFETIICIPENLKVNLTKFY